MYPKLLKIKFIPYREFEDVLGRELWEVITLGTAEDKQHDEYGLKGTFSLNSGRFEIIDTSGRKDTRNIVKEEVAQVYKNHEVAVHTLTYSYLTELSDEEFLYQVSEGQKNLSSLCGHDDIFYCTNSEVLLNRK